MTCAIVFLAFFAVVVAACAWSNTGELNTASHPLRHDVTCPQLGLMSQVQLARLGVDPAACGAAGWTEGNQQAYVN